jgi:L-amino acid N-acyltransferase YncA
LSDDTIRKYPRQTSLGEDALTLDLMTAADRDDVLALARELPRHDLLFLRRDISNPASLDEWLGEIERGFTTTILARQDGEVVGYATLNRSDLRWSAHVGELRIMVAESFRGRGLGSLLTQEIFALALDSGLEKMVARMTLDQKGAIATFEGLGFRPEALLRDHVKDLDGKKHDLIMMSHSVAEFEATLEAYGVPESLEIE